MQNSHGIPRSSGIFGKFPFFYGWIIVAAGSLGMLFSVPGQTIGVSVFTDYLITALGLTRDQLSLAYMIGTLGSAAVLSFSGLLLDRIGSRIYGAAVSVLLGSVLIILSFIDNAVNGVRGMLDSANPVVVAMVFMSLGFFLLRFLGQGSMTLVSRNLPMRWFTRRRGLVSAIVGTIVSFGFNAAPALYDVLIQASGWKGAWRISGAVVLVLGTAMYLIVVRENPESVGLTQDGLPDASASDKTAAGDLGEAAIATADGSKEASSEPEAAANGHGEEPDLPAAMRTVPFWVFGLSLGLFSLYVTGFTFHVVSIFQEAGIERSVAVSIFIPASILSVIINAVVSTISDFVRLKWILLVLLAGLAIQMVTVAFLAPGAMMLVIIIAGNGLSGGTFNALTTLVWPRFYGTTHLGAISGFAMGILVAGSALGPIMLSLSLSIFGSYGLAALILAALVGVLTIAAIPLKEADPPGRAG